MNAVAIAIGSAVLIFAAIVIVLLGLDKLNPKSIEGSRIPVTGRSPARIRKTVSHMLLFLVLAMLAVIIVSISHRMFAVSAYLEKAGQTAQQSRETNERMQRLARFLREDPLPGPTMPPALPGTAEPSEGLISPEETRALTTTAEEEETSPYSGQGPAHVTLFGSAFSPKTGNGTHDQTSENGRSPLTIPPRTILLKNAAPTDLFVAAVFDRLEKGRLYRSDLLRITPPAGRAERTIEARLSLPGAVSGTRLQLPFLPNGSIVPIYTTDTVYTIEGDGTLSLAKNTGPLQIEYLIKKHPAIGTISSVRQEDESIRREYADFPADLSALLTPARRQSSFVKMATVAAVLHTYCTYATDTPPLRVRDNGTWSGLLTASLREGRRLCADCDVLTTYSFICFSFLQMRALALIVYLDLPGYEDRLAEEELHAMLLVDVDGTWTLFEPTLFTEKAPREPAAPQTAPLTDNPPVPGPLARETEFLLPRTDIACFTLPPALQERLQHPAAAAPLAQAGSLFVDALRFERDRSPDPEPVAAVTPKQFVLQSAVILYLICLLLGYLFSLIREEPPPWGKWGSVSRSFVLTGSLLSAATLLIRSSAIATVNASVNDWRTLAAVIFACASALVSVTALLLLPGSSAPAGGKASSARVFTDEPYLGASLALAIAATFFAPGTVSLISLLCIGIGLIGRTRLK